jgi:hypothetical protein
VRRGVCALLLWGLVLGARADDGWERNILTLNLDNDTTIKRDRHYTSGVRLSYLSADDFVPDWVQRTARFLPAFGFENAAQKWGVEVGQEIYTPENLRSTALLPEDRPYAGWLYGSLGLLRRGPGPGRTWVMETLRLDLGVVGPEALGEQAQDMAHANDPQGWDNQLNSEIAFVFRYLRRYRLAWRSREQTWGLDLLPQFNANLGSLDVSLGMGGEVRAGYQIPNEFAIGSRPVRFGAYLFAGVSGQAVLHNLFLDGNTFTDSHSVPKEPVVGRARVGVTWVFRPIELTVAHTFMTREFKTQDGTDSFSSVFATLKF